MLKYSIKGKTMVVKFTESELDHHVSIPIREQLDDLINSNYIDNVIFDFDNMTFMDSSGIGVIIGRYKKISRDGGKVSIININDRVKKIFKLSGIDKIVGIHDTYEEALNSF